jgi:hypothetical protein
VPKQAVAVDCAKCRNLVVDRDWLAGRRPYPTTIMGEHRPLPVIDLERVVVEIRQVEASASRSSCR